MRIAKITKILFIKGVKNFVGFALALNYSNLVVSLIAAGVSNCNDSEVSLLNYIKSPTTDTTSQDDSGSSSFIQNDASSNCSSVSMVCLSLIHI